MPEFKGVFGIDLGTTFSAIAYVDQFDKAVVIPNRENKPVTPSVLYFNDPSDSTNYLTGENAINMLMADPANAVAFIKNHMGEEGYKRKIHGRFYTPQELSAMILKKLASDASTYLREQGLDSEVKDVVITVPAYFGMEQRSATLEAGKLAGLNVLMLLNEPTAAALAYGINKSDTDKTIFVFDLGGGTFDVTILLIKDGSLKQVCSDGDAQLGGKDWDDDLLTYCCNEFSKLHGTNPQDDPHSYQDLYERVVKAKIALSKLAKTTVVINHNGQRETIEIKREVFEQITKSRVDQCERCCKSVLEKANMSWPDIDTVLLVGGSTYMPMIRAMIKNLSGQDPSTEINPDLSVAIGAAYQAAYRYIEEESKQGNNSPGKSPFPTLPPVPILECVAKSLGIIVLDNKQTEYVYEMIPEMTDIPHEIEDEFAYAYEGQTSVSARVTEGKGHKPTDVCIVGEVVLSKLPPRPKGTPLKVIYKYNRDKTLDVEVVDVETGLKQKGQVKFEGTMSEKDFDEAKAHLKGLQHD